MSNQVYSNAEYQYPVTGIVESDSISTKFLAVESQIFPTIKNLITSNPTAPRANPLPDASGVFLLDTASQVVENKQLVDSNTSIVDYNDRTKRIIFDADGNTLTTTTIRSSQTSDIIVTLPSVTSTLATTTDLTGYVTLSTPQTITNKTINTTTNNILVHSASDTNINSLLDQALLTTSSPTFSGLTIKNGATNKTALVSAAATTTSQAIFPDGIGYVVMRDLAQVLTNKTLTTPVIAQIVNSGTLTLPTSTDTLVGRATSDDLTNKRLFSGSSWFVNDADTTKSFTILNYGSTGTSLQLQSAPTANRVVEIPDASTVLVGTGTTQTLTNKTIAYGSNTITGLPISSTGYAAYYLANSYNVSNLVITVVTLDTALATDSGITNSPSGTFTINTTGMYTFSATVDFQLAASGGLRNMFFELNGGIAKYGLVQTIGNATYDTVMNSTFTAKLTAGDVIKVKVTQVSGGNVALVGSSASGGTSMCMIQITRTS